MTPKETVCRYRKAHCVKAPGRPPLYWVHAEHMPYLGKGNTERAAWASAALWLKQHRRYPPKRFS